MSAKRSGLVRNRTVGQLTSERDGVVDNDNVDVLAELVVAETVADVVVEMVDGVEVMDVSMEVELTSVAKTGDSCWLLSGDPSALDGD